VLDQPHSLTLVSSSELGQRWRIGGRIRYTGNPRSRSRRLPGRRRRLSRSTDRCCRRGSTFQLDVASTAPGGGRGAS
jgi:hypothetical protein